MCCKVGILLVQGEGKGVPWRNNFYSISGEPAWVHTDPEPLRFQEKSLDISTFYTYVICALFFWGGDLPTSSKASSRRWVTGKPRGGDTFRVRAQSDLWGSGHHDALLWWDKTKLFLKFTTCEKIGLVSSLSFSMLDLALCGASVSVAFCLWVSWSCWNSSFQFPIWNVCLAERTLCQMQSLPHCALVHIAPRFHLSLDGSVRSLPDWMQKLFLISHVLTHNGLY